MSRIQKELTVLKEITEVGEFAIALIQCIRNKGDYAALLPQLIAAIEGVGGIGDEIKDTPALVSTGFYIGNGILQAFLPEPTDE